MKQALGILLVLAIGLGLSRRWFRTSRLQKYTRFYYLTGEEFLLLGVVLGPAAANLIDRAALGHLEPFVGLGLGYIGFVFGMQFRRRDLAGVPASYYAGTAAETLATAVLLGAALALALGGPAAATPRTTAAVAALVATGVGTSTSFLFLLDRNTQLGRSPVFRFMRFSSVFDDLFGVALFGAALCALRSPQGGLATAGWLGVSVVLGLLCGGLLLAASRMELGEKEELLFLLGIILFSGGLASYLRLSPVFVNAVAGIWFCNLAERGREYHQRLLRVEKPIYLFMLVLAGAMWRASFAGLGGLLAVYVASRLVGKYLGGLAAGRALFPGQRFTSDFGLGLTAQSEMAVAMMVNILLLYPEDPLMRLAVSAVFLAVLLNYLLSSVYFATRVRRI